MSQSNARLGESGYVSSYIFRRFQVLSQRADDVSPILHQPKLAAAKNRGVSIGVDCGDHFGIGDSHQMLARTRAPHLAGREIVRL